MTFRVSKLELFYDVRGSQRKLFIHGHVVHLRTEELDLPLTLHTSSSHELEIFKGEIRTILTLLVPLTLRDLLRTPVLAEGIELTPSEDELVEMFHSLRSYSQTVVFEKVVSFVFETAEVITTPIPHIANNELRLPISILLGFVTNFAHLRQTV